MPDDTFTPPVRDYHTKHERDDHAPNQALHDALTAAFDTADDSDHVTVNLMASHAPGEKPHDPTYEVRVESRNEGMGHPMIPTPVRRLVDRNDAKITGVVECSDDHLVVSLRPIEARVEPVEVEYRHVPDDFIHRRDAAQIVAGLAEEIEPDGDTTSPAIEDAVEAARDAARWLNDDVDVWEGPTDERVSDAAKGTTRRITHSDADADDEDVFVPDASPGELADVLNHFIHRADVPPNYSTLSILPAIRDRLRSIKDATDGTRIPCGCGDFAVEVPDGSTPPSIDVEAHDTGFPKTRPAESAVRSYVERRLPDAAEDVDAGVIADMVENFVVSDSVWGKNAVFKHDDTGADE